MSYWNKKRIKKISFMHSDVSSLKIARCVLLKFASTNVLLIYMRFLYNVQQNHVFSKHGPPY
jgi:hypothetical protein